MTKSKHTSAWRDYRVGNCLRGYDYFKARSLVEAWKRGCAIFERGFPSDPKGDGRSVILEVYFYTPLPTTKFDHEQELLPKKKRYFSNHEMPVRGFVAVAHGCTRQPLILDNGPGRAAEWECRHSGVRRRTYREIYPAGKKL